MKITLNTLLFLCICTWNTLSAREFQVLTYNVENLFDGDGQAEFDYYEQDTGKPFSYSIRKLYTKIDNIVTVLKEFNEGKGPDVIAFQEFERDVSPPLEPYDLTEYFARFKGRSLKSMLGAGFNRVVGDLPVELLLLKHMEDEGLTGYSIAMPENYQPNRQYSAHTNAVFTRFPIKYVKQYPVDSARDIMEVGLEVNSQQFILFNNHWKSGASNPATEKTRIQNATVLRNRLSEILASNPYADIIIAGDLNSHYNQAQVYAEMAKTGINSILKSQGDETALLKGKADLYNLWFELPADQRGSDTFRGQWGTLMHMLITPGLYDRAGLQYVDGSFDVVDLPGLNTNEHFGGEPVSWSNYGEMGRGFSDHLPLVATFRANELGMGRAGVFNEPEAPSTVPTGPASLIPVDYTLPLRKDLARAKEIKDYTEDDVARNLGRPYFVEEPWATRRNEEKQAVKIGNRVIQIHMWDDEVKEAFKEKRKRYRSGFVAYLDEFRGELYFNIPEVSWLQ